MRHPVEAMQQHPKIIRKLRISEDSAQCMAQRIGSARPTDDIVALRGLSGRMHLAVHTDTNDRIAEMLRYDTWSAE